MKTIASLCALLCLALPRMQAAQEPPLPPLPDLPELPPLPELVLLAEPAPSSAQDPDAGRAQGRTARDLAESSRRRAVEDRARAEQARERAEQSRERADRARVRAEARAQQARERAESRRAEVERRRERSSRGRHDSNADMELLDMLERLERRLDALEGRRPSGDAARRKCAPSRVDVRVVRPDTERWIQMRPPAAGTDDSARLEHRLDALEGSLRTIERRLEDMTPCRCGEKKSGDSVSRLDPDRGRGLRAPVAYAAR